MKKTVFCTAVFFERVYQAKKDMCIKESGEKMECTGIEPVTSTMPLLRSTN